MKDDLFDMYLDEAKNTPFSGWNFRYYTDSNRLVFNPLRWNYYNVVLPYLRKSETLLDMGTGGGEVLSRFAPLPQKTYATESYHLNVAIAKKALESLGVQVVEMDGIKYPNNEKLPFADEFFDIIINRHESFHPPEVFRVLKDGGYFISQQVGPPGYLTIKKTLTYQDKEKDDWGLQKVIGQFKSVGFKIKYSCEDYQAIRYFDIGAIAYYLKAIPWIIEDFNIDKYKDGFYKLHQYIQKNGFFEEGHRIFIFVAEKPSKISRKRK